MALGRFLSYRYPSIPPSERLVSALILDSSPAVGDLGNIIRAFTIAIPNPVARYIALPIIYVIHALRLSIVKAIGGETMEIQYLKTLLQPRLLPWMSAQTPRLYVYSKRDELVPWKDVQKHADAAKKSGLNVCCEVYEGSAHVAHMRHDPERYWTSILGLWHVAVAKAE